MGAKLGAGLLFMSALVAFTSTAGAQDAVATCNDAFEKADLDLAALDGGDLIAAREKLRICAGPDCKDWMTKECASKLVAVEARIPSVVFDITDGTGEAIVDVKVTTRERTLLERSDGHAVELNPGAYPVVVTLPDGRHLERTVVLHEGVKGRVVSIAFPAPPTAPPPPAPVVEQPPAPVVKRQTGSWPLALTGFGIAAGAAIVGTVTGIAALNHASTLESRCPSKACGADRDLEDTRDAGQRLGNVSTIAFLMSAGGIALGLLMFPNGPITIGVGPGSVGATGRF